MADFPSLPLKTDAYIGDTQHLTLEEHGAYLKLLMIAWRTAECAIPDDDKRIATMLGVTPKKWATLKPAVMAFWSLRDGFWTQKRLTKERRRVEELRDQKRAAGEASAKAKSRKNNDTASTGVAAGAQRSGNGTANETAAIPEPEPESSSDTYGSSGEEPTASGGRAAGQAELSLVADNGITLAQFEEMAESEKALYRYGKAVFGNGGQVTKVRKLYPGDQRAAADLIRQASQKADPNEWLGAVLRGDDSADTPDHILYPPGVYENIR